MLYSFFGVRVTFGPVKNQPHNQLAFRTYSNDGALLRKPFSKFGPSTGKKINSAPNPIVPVILFETALIQTKRFFNAVYCHFGNCKMALPRFPVSIQVCAGLDCKPSPQRTTSDQESSAQDAVGLWGKI